MSGTSSSEKRCVSCSLVRNSSKDRGTIRTKGGAAGTVSSRFRSSLQATKGSGSPLPESARSFMESRFGHDFSGVRVHTDQRASGMNREINSLAFTHGRDIYFSKGRFDPDSLPGKRLLAHELTHVVQQSGAEPGIQRVSSEERGEDLRSDRLKDDKRLQRAFDNSPAMRRGETGEGVKTLQRAFKDLGYVMPVSFKNTGDADGIFGSETEGTTRRFQADHDLAADGVAGRNTLGALDEEYLQETPPKGGGATPQQATCTKQQHNKDFASVMAPVFNTIDPAVKPRGNAPGEVMFYTGGVQDRNVWEVNANVNMSPVDPGDLVNWLHGMIQSADNLVFEAEYDGGVKAKRESASSRDCAGKNVAEPWIYDVPLSYGPQTMGMQASFADHPRQPFPEAHPTSPGARIRRISCRGAFNIWHVAVNKQLTLDQSNVVSLGNTRVSLDLKADLQPNGNWVGSVGGKNGMSNAVCGKGSKTPVLKTPLTIDDLSSLK